MKKKIVSVISLLFLCIMIISAGAIGRIYYQRASDKKGFEKIYDIVNAPPADTTVNMETDSSSADSAPDSESSTQEAEPVSKRNLAPLFEINSDCAGWVCIPNTTVNYPFMHTPDDHQKYLRKNFDGSYSISGIPFLQGNCTLDCDNLIIYGHNMKNGTMFFDLTGYVDKSFCDSNPVIEVETSDGIKLYTVYAAAQVKSNHPWYGFTEADSCEDLQEKLSLLEDAILYTTDTDPEYGRQLLTLSTCYGPSQDDRLIVIAVLND